MCGFRFLIFWVCFVCVCVRMCHINQYQTGCISSRGTEKNDVFFLETPTSFYDRIVQKNMFETTCSAFKHLIHQFNRKNRDCFRIKLVIHFSDLHRQRIIRTHLRNLRKKNWNFNQKKSLERNRLKGRKCFGIHFLCNLHLMFILHKNGLFNFCFALFRMCLCHNFVCLLTFYDFQFKSQNL